MTYFNEIFQYRLPVEEDARKTAFNQGLQGWQDSSRVTMTEMIVIHQTSRITIISVIVTWLLSCQSCKPWLKAVLLASSSFGSLNRYFLSKNDTVANVLISWLILTKKNLFRLPTEEDAKKTAFNQGLQGWQDSSQVTMTEMIVILEV